MGMTASFVALPHAKLNELKADSEGLPKFFSEHIESGAPETVLDIDKSWQGIHFLLTGEPYGGEEPYSLPVLGGVEIGEDIGYGPARYLEPIEVQAAAAALAKVSIADLRNRYIPAKLEAADVYPCIWESEGDEAFEYLVPWYEALQQFYALAAARGDAMLLAIL